LASLVISSAKTVGQALSSEVGTKSKPEDLAGIYLFIYLFKSDHKDP
jgi:hypothetical protein